MNLFCQILRIALIALALNKMYDSEALIA
jgi:hypothetical protein